MNLRIKLALVNQHRLFAQVMLTPKALEKQHQNYKNLFLENVFVLSLLSVLSYLLYFQRIPKFSLSLDGFFYTYLQYLNQLSNFSLIGPKDYGRPFLGLAWNLALLLGGGAVDGYNYFMFTCITLSSIFTFWLLRLILGCKLRLLTFLIALLKLVWSCNYEIFDNSSLAIYFAEMFFWLALLCFTLLKLHLLRGFGSGFVYLVMLIAIVIPLGIYQPIWAFILLFPILINWQKPGVFKSQKHLALLAWYIPAIVTISVCYATSREFAGRNFPGIPIFFERFVLGVKAATIDSFLTVFLKLSLNLKATPLWFTVLILTTLVVACYLLGRHELKLNHQEFNQRESLPYELAGASLFLIAIGILPFCLIAVPAYGSRYIHWAAIGSIMLLLSLVTYLLQQNHRIARFMALLLICILIFIHTLEIWQIGNLYEINVYAYRRFWTGLLSALPSISEKTYVVFDQPITNMATVDYTCTSILRNFTGTKETFCFTESNPSYSDDKSSVILTTKLDLNHTETGTLASSEYFANAPAKPVKLPIDQVIWMNWNPNSFHLSLLPDQDFKARISRTRKSNYGVRLFPNGK